MESQFSNIGLSLMLIICWIALFRNLYPLGRDIQKQNIHPRFGGVVLFTSYSALLSITVPIWLIVDQIRLLNW